VQSEACFAFEITERMGGLPLDAARLTGDTSAMSDDVIYGFIPKNKREELQVAVREYEGRPMISMMVFRKNAEGNYVRTGKGFNFGIDLVPAIVEALQRAEGGGQGSRGGRDDIHQDQTG
jgi:hypothetical protein